MKDQLLEGETHPVSLPLSYPSRPPSLRTKRRPAEHYAPLSSTGRVGGDQKLALRRKDPQLRETLVSLSSRSPPVAQLDLKCSTSGAKTRSGYLLGRWGGFLTYLKPNIHLPHCVCKHVYIFIWLYFPRTIGYSLGYTPPIIFRMIEAAKKKVITYFEW